ncbi:hypothetical protein [Halobellus clavatus]|jgi:hypothetical protein|uniref:Uncharacterized protein n=1 Tax=Halobellus clavatus TaxID=660517 RepID=A0A1H3EZN9_9EURY|nr:hypothetical protein [Halobellus clavatus]SDX83429.1 hypothetical protein SAMN04487946_10312 [Halobellus clavatus]
MADETMETIATLLRSSIESTEDPEINYKLRTALQLLDVVETREARAIDLLADEEFDDDLRGRLEDLGYLE